MNWDLIIGLIIGLSGSIMTLIGTIISNKQNHKHELNAIKQNHEHGINVISKNHDYEKEMIKQNHIREKEIMEKNQREEFKRFILENSFKEYELKAKVPISKGGDDEYTSRIYPFDMYLASYLKIANYLQNDDPDYFELNHLINELKGIKDMYDSAPNLGR